MQKSPQEIALEVKITEGTFADERSDLFYAELLQDMAPLPLTVQLRLLIHLVQTRLIDS